MSGARPETAEELDMLAGEYVLGVLGSAEMRAMDEQATLDPRLGRAIAGWEQRLAPMLTAVAERAPPDALWARIEHAKSIAHAKPVAPDARQDGKAPARLTLVPSRGLTSKGTPPAASRRVWPWKVATVASLALAAGLAAIVLMPALAPRLGGPLPGARDVALVAVLAAQPDSPGESRQDAAPQMATYTGVGRQVEPAPDTPDPARVAGRVAGFLAATWPDGTVVLTAFAPVAVPGGKTLELWIQPPDAKAPRSLGLLPAAGREVLLPTMPADGTALSVSLEPPGGSPTGAPTGRVVYAGTLRQMQP